MTETTPTTSTATPAASAAVGGQQPLLEVRDLKMHFPIRGGLLRREVGRVHAVDGVSFSLYPGETLGLVGESGCGKTTVGRCILKLYTPTSGQILFEGQDIAPMKGEPLNKVRRQIQSVFQDPYASLNPRLTVKEIVGEAYRLQTRDKQWVDRVAELMQEVGLRPEQMSRYPHEFSGGQRQRIGIARALSLRPKLIVADEPVSALDVSIRAQVINLLDNLKEKYHFSYLFVAHDLSVVEHISDRVAVMYLGQMMEIGTDVDLYSDPLHPYSQALLSAVPRPEPGARKRAKTILRGDVPSPVNPPSGCHFHTRCPHVMPICREQQPKMTEQKPGHQVACFLFEAGAQPNA